MGAGASRWVPPSRPDRKSPGSPGQGQRAAGVRRKPSGTSRLLAVSRHLPLHLGLAPSSGNAAALTNFQRPRGPAPRRTQEAGVLFAESGVAEPVKGGVRSHPSFWSVLERALAGYRGSRGVCDPELLLLLSGRPPCHSHQEVGGTGMCEETDGRGDPPARKWEWRKARTELYAGQPLPKGGN